MRGKGYQGPWVMFRRWGMVKRHPYSDQGGRGRRITPPKYNHHLGAEEFSHSIFEPPPRAWANGAGGRTSTAWTQSGQHSYSDLLRSARDTPIEFSSKSNSKLVSDPPLGLFIVGVVEEVVVVVVIITVVVQLQHSINDPMVVFVAVGLYPYRFFWIHSFLHDFFSPINSIKRCYEHSKLHDLKKCWKSCTSPNDLSIQTY